jgi:hypothetical protein
MCCKKSARLECRSIRLSDDEMEQMGGKKSGHETIHSGETGDKFLCRVGERDWRTKMTNFQNKQHMLYMRHCALVDSFPQRRKY